MIRDRGGNPFLLDSLRPTIKLADYRGRELRFRALTAAHPEEAERLTAVAQQAVDRRWQVYERMAAQGAEGFDPDTRPPERNA